MKLVYWTTDPNEGAEHLEIGTPEELWAVVRRKRLAISEEDEYIQEISANEEPDGTPYLVLSWVEVE